MGKIIYITNVDRRHAMMSACSAALVQEGKLDPATACWKTKDGDAWNTSWQSRLTGADFVCIRWMGTTLKTDFWNKCRRFLESRHIPYYIDAAGSAEKEARYLVRPEVIEKTERYLAYSGRANYTALFLYHAAIFCGSSVPYDPPRQLPWTGIFHPDLPGTYTTDRAAYEKKFCRPGRPTIGMLFYRDEWIWSDVGYQTAVIREIEKQGMNAVCVFTNGMPLPEMGMPALRTVFRDFFTRDGNPWVGAILNAMKFSFTASGSITVPELIQLGIPVLQAYTVIAPYEEWKSSVFGLSDMEVSISVTVPEFDGIIHGVPIASKYIHPDGDVEYRPIKDRIIRMVSKAGKWARLAHKKNGDKRIAIVFHNYPPKNSNIGSAVGLDTIESIRRVLARMKEEGYTVRSIPENTEDFIKELTANATNDLSLMTEAQADAAQRVPASIYRDFYETFGEAPRAQMEKDWGKAPGTVMIGKDGAIIVPGTMNGSVFVTVQAPRGYGMDPAKIYHDPYVAPTHQYEAFYQWIRDVWKADAVIHVGTHGNLEWLPGKGTGLDADSYPDSALGDLPNIYPYHMTITGEGMQAKRRGAACLIGHLPAPMTDAGLYDETAELGKILEDYAHFCQTDPAQAKSLEAMIRERAQKANLDGEIPYDEARPFSEYAETLARYLEDLKDSEVHMGLHILGQPPENDILTEYILQLLRLSNGDEHPSILELFAESYGTTVEEIGKKAGTICQAHGITYSAVMDRVRDEARTLVKTLQEGHFTSAAGEKAMALPFISGQPEPWQEKVQSEISYICGTVHPKLMETRQEEENLFRALEGKYIEPGPSGSPAAGGVDLLPSGRNFVGVDPRCLPTPAAWEIGKVLGDEAVDRFITEEGRYPENIGMVFWAGANMRSRGQCIAEFLYLMGLRPDWKPGSLQVQGLIPIPLSELKRPRIDVTARISGLFRDTMPSVARLLDDAVLLAASLPESDEDNFVKHHIGEDSSELEQQGMTKEEAWRTAAYRVFGDAPGTYGAGVAALLDAGNWDNIDDIADVFVRWGGHAYGGKTKGAYMPDAFRKRLGAMDLTIKNEDNHETNMLSSDDYNAYHGGMIAAVRSISGKAPRSYCGDSTNRDKPALRSVQEEMKRVFRSESINPKYIHGMMNHGYKGAADMANMVAHSYQWDATSAVMDDWMYEKYAEKYAFDKTVQDWMKQVNPWALQRITETLLEADKRNLWNAKDETRDKLRQLYLEIEGELEDDGDEY